MVNKLFGVRPGNAWPSERKDIKAQPPGPLILGKGALTRKILENISAREKPADAFWTQDDTTAGVARAEDA